MNAHDDAQLRTDRARQAALTRWAGTPPSQRSRTARAAFRRRFETQVDPDNELSPADRAVMVDAAIKAYTARMRYLRSRKRHQEST